MKNVLTPARGAILAALFVGAGMTADAQLRSALDVGERATRSASQAQARINQLDDERSDLVREFRTLVQRKDAAQLFVRQQEQVVASQTRELESLEVQLGRVDEITSVMIPMMLDMIDDLEAFIEADLPFELESRRARIASLREVMKRADVVPAEQYRLIIDAYQAELEVGNTVNTWTDEVSIQDRPTDVHMFRYGRVALVYLTRDDRKAARWDRASRSWVDLDSSYNENIRVAIKAAKELIQPEILFGPISPLATSAPPAVAPAVLQPEVDAYRSVLSQTENLGVFANQQEQILISQENEIALLEERIATAEERNLEVRPLLEQMFVDLKDFVAADLPFKTEERADRIAALEASLNDGELSAGELTSLILAAYKIELDEGSVQEVWNEQIDIDGSGTLQEVRLYRYGRAAMVYVSLDRSKAGRFDRQTRQWVPVGAAMRNDIIKATKIADGIAQRSILFAPVSKFSAESP
jgi:hypothetical protein